MSKVYWHYVLYFCIGIAVLLISGIIRLYLKEDYWKDPRDIDPDPYE